MIDALRAAGAAYEFLELMRPRHDCPLPIKGGTVRREDRRRRPTLAWEDGSVITDHEVRDALKAKGFAKPTLEWMRCSPADVL